MDFLFLLINKILMIFKNVMDIFSLWTKRKNLQDSINNEKKENSEIKQKIEDNIKNSDLNKINDDLGWKNKS